MTTPTVHGALIRYADRKKLQTQDPREIMFLLYVKEGKSLGDIATLLNVTRPGVAYQVRAMGLPIQPPGRRALLGGRVRALGYTDLRSYFHSASKKSFEAMASELGVTPETVRRHYEVFVAEVTSPVAV